MNNQKQIVYALLLLFYRIYTLLSDVYFQAYILFSFYIIDRTSFTLSQSPLKSTGKQLKRVVIISNCNELDLEIITSWINQFPLVENTDYGKVQIDLIRNSIDGHARRNVRVEWVNALKKADQIAIFDSKLSINDNNGDDKSGKEEGIIWRMAKVDAVDLMIVDGTAGGRLGQILGYGDAASLALAEIQFLPFPLTRPGFHYALRRYFECEQRFGK